MLHRQWKWNHSMWIFMQMLHLYFWFKYNSGQKYYAPQVQPDQGSNSWPPDHDSSFHVTETSALTTWPSVTSNLTSDLYAFTLVGEDRWLCTLLLQQGYRIEYSAAADALTHAPEGFSEFYNQRRRWGPSTMANIVDLLQSYRYYCNSHNKPQCAL